MDKSIKLTFKDIEVIMKVLEKEKANTTDQARRQMMLVIKTRQAQHGWPAA